MLLLYPDYSLEPSEILMGYETTGRVCGRLNETQIVNNVSA